jgi:hypothetical protein
MTRLFIVVIAILVVVGVALAATGVLHVQNTKDETGITIDKKEFKEKAQEAVKTTTDAGGKILDKTSEALHNAADGLRKPSDDRNPPATTPQRGENR